ncbi:MAG: tRNA uridine-5-carboxymethylaminomethyl(34) synthesis GTPase MnmE [Eubacteriaceae bacterium]|nr:tRNA uridine-5-carboxymethylaminomethyl(34) synthesis GTPase MnmE [Eubacteriaceae bacterium]
MFYIDDTIAAISTPLGFSGIGIVRMTGSESFAIAQKVFKAAAKDFSTVENRKIIFGHILDDSGKVIDEVLVSKMAGPNTYTREDVVEINCHGGLIPVRKILDLLLIHGARLAEPGEFTKRAFINGRIDLSQAEAVIDVINSKTEKSLNISMKQLEGSLSLKIKQIREELLEILAHIEASIDYPEYDIEEMSFELILGKSKKIRDDVEELIKNSESGRIIREGIKTAIIGKPNVGKSSLLNKLLGEERAIVTEIAGTTRDTIEEYISIRGIPLKIIDTAGIRETDNIIEKIGISKTKEILVQSDFVLLLLDAGSELDEEDLILMDLVKDKKGIVVINKIDKELMIDKNEVIQRSHMETAEISLLNDTGVSSLKDQIYDNISVGEIDSESYELVSNIRHIQLLKETSEALKEAGISLESGLPVEMISVDIKNAWDKLGSITGETVTEDIVDEIFSKFCIGK